MEKPTKPIAPLKPHKPSIKSINPVQRSTYYVFNGKVMSPQEYEVSEDDNPLYYAKSIVDFGALAKFEQSVRPYRSFEVEVIDYDETYDVDYGESGVLRIAVHRDFDDASVEKIKAENQTRLKKYEASLKDYEAEIKKYDKAWAAYKIKKAEYMLQKAQNKFDELTTDVIA